MTSIGKLFQVFEEPLRANRTAAKKTLERKVTKWVLSAVTAGLALGCCGEAGAQVPHILGSWQLNPEASRVPGGVPEGLSDTRVYSLRDDGYLVGLAISIYPNGVANFLQFAAKSDGKEYPEYETSTLAELQVSGTATPMTYSETVVDEYTVAVTDKRGGIITGQGTRSVSEDGGTMTVRFVAPGPGGQGSTMVLVYDRIDSGR